MLKCLISVYTSLITSKAEFDSLYRKPKIILCNCNFWECTMLCKAKSYYVDICTCSFCFFHCPCMHIEYKPVTSCNFLASMYCKEGMNITFNKYKNYIAASCRKLKTAKTISFKCFEYAYGF